jgi:LytS/YehU family sensor histidine kinase
MTIRRVAAASTAAFAAIGLLRGCVQLTGGSRSAHASLVLFATTVAISLFWLPVTLWSALRWKRGASRWQQALSHGLALTLVAGTEPMWTLTVLRQVNARAAALPYLGMFIGRLDTNLLFYAAIVGTIWATDNAARQAAIRLAGAKLESALSDARLHVLTLQLHPHFLFNTLNLISQLAYRDRPAARRTLANLRALLVQSLELALRRNVTLREELRFLRAYLEIQQRRFGSRLRVRVDADDASLDAALPSLVLQPLVENAIAHGIGDREQGGEIVVTARVAGHRLLLTVEDDGVGPRQYPIHEGMGLTNTRLRLHQLSGGDYDFTLAHRAGGGSIVSIGIPFAAAESAPPSTKQRDAVNVADIDDSTLRSPPSRARLALQMIAGWTAVAMLWTELDTVSRIGTHRPVAWSTSVLSSVINATIWAALVPLIVWLSRRFDLTQGRSPATILAHAGGAMLAAAAHVCIYLGVLRAFVPADYPAQLENSYAWALWDLAAYVAVLAFSTAVTLGVRQRESFAHNSVTNRRLVQARIATLRMQLQPGVLLAGLGAIDRTMALDPALAERSITRMGDLLRLLLARGDRDTVSLGSELAALRAYLDVIGSSAHVDAADALYDAALPSMLLTPLAASVDGVSSVSVHRRGAALCVEVRGHGTMLDEPLIDALRQRLNACLGTRWTLTTRAEAGATIMLQVPLVGYSEGGDPGYLGVSRARIA